ncbi:P-loop containing nucleoside triphosphate hydrolase protein, partial [Bombardia bombarda]
IPRLAFTSFSLTQPYLVNSTILYIAVHKIVPASYGYGLIGAWALCYIGIAIVTRWWSQIAFRTMTKLRGSLVTIIYKNMLTVRSESANSSSALSLMSTDVDRITQTTFQMVNIMPDILQVAFSLLILGLQLGASCVAPVILCLITGGIAGFIARLIPPRQRKWMAAIQKRVGITSDIISSMKGVKVAGLSEKAGKQIQGLRDYELEQSTQFRKIQIFTLLLGVAPTILMPAVTFTVFAIAQSISGGSQLSVAQAFTSLSLLNILFMPIMNLTRVWTDVMAAMACLDRIQAFLLREKREDYRTLVSYPGSASSMNKDSSTEIDDRLEKKEKVEEPWIQVRGGGFGWSKDPETQPIVKNLDFDIMPAQLTIVVGPVASGKSTLLKALLGEAYMLSGSVELTIPEEIAYCDQDAWLLNQTVKENILAFEQYDKGFYDQVIQACQLNEDLELLPSGDDTLIGSKGISLSGGQKQRVALARAVYNRKAIVILDDILKGLDADTYSKCFTAILGPEGLLRRSRTAVILATHNIQLLPHADNIIVLGDNGEIVEKGTFDELNSAEGSYVSGLGLTKSAAIGNDLLVDEDVDEAEKEKNEKFIFAKIESVKNKETAGKKNDEDLEGPSRGKRNADALFAYIRSLGNLNFAMFCIFTVCNVGFRSAVPLWLNVWTSANEAHPNDRIAYYVGIFDLFSGLNVITMGLQFWIFMIVIVPHSAKVLHKKVLNAAMHAPMSFFVSTDTGEIVNRFSQDMTLVDLALPFSFLLSYSQIIGALALIILTCVSSGWLAIAIPVLIIVLLILQKFYLRTSRQMRLLDLEAKSPLYSHFISSFEGLAALRAYGWTKRAEKESTMRLDDSQRPYYLLFCLQRWLTMVLDLIVAGLAVLLVGLTVALKDSINPGLLGVALTSVMGIGQTLSMLIQSWTQLETSLGAVTRITQFEMDTPKELDGPDMPAPEWPATGTIHISGLHAKYGDRMVLTDINLDIRPGEKVAVCGRSGSGKSTLIMLLLRLYQPESGSIAIDGVDTATLNLNALRESLVALPQDPMFLAGSVRYNLDPLGKYRDEEIIMALEKTGIHGVIEEKGGLDTDLNTDWLSAGQRQLFCLARAMLRRSKVLLLDEATSSLDRQTETFVDELIRTAFKEWTAIVVAHRLKTVADFDKILVLQDGHVVEFDSPGNLLAKEDSIFKALWDLQES